MLRMRATVSKYKFGMSSRSGMTTILAISVNTSSMQRSMVSCSTAPSASPGTYLPSSAAARLINCSAVWDSAMRTGADGPYLRFFLAFRAKVFFAVVAATGAARAAGDGFRVLAFAGAAGTSGVRQIFKILVMTDGLNQHGVFLTVEFGGLTIKEGLAAHLAHLAVIGRGRVLHLYLVRHRVSPKDLVSHENRRENPRRFNDLPHIAFHQHKVGWGRAERHRCHRRGQQNVGVVGKLIEQPARRQRRQRAARLPHRIRREEARVISQIAERQHQRRAGIEIADRAAHALQYKASGDAQDGHLCVQHNVSGNQRQRRAAEYFFGARKTLSTGLRLSIGLSWSHDHDLQDLRKKERRGEFRAA